MTTKSSNKMAKPITILILEHRDANAEGINVILYVIFLVRGTLTEKNGEGSEVGPVL